MTIQMIALNLLVPSAANVRKTGRLSGIEELAASIEAHGLLQNLQVRPIAKGKFEVAAGGRRLAALKLLAKQKKIAKDFAVCCHLLDAEDDTEISLAENIVRLNMHPADQFDAFHALSMKGNGVEEIAARFGVSVTIVRQRLKLATVSPTLIDLYRQDEMSLDHLMAFTVSDDHAAQEAAWFDSPAWNRHPSTIRQTLTRAHVESHDRRVRFIGLDAYVAAGGGIIRDLFDEENGGYLTDPALLDRLVAEKLEAEAAGLRGEGWAWVEIQPRIDHAVLSGYGRVYPDRLPLPSDRQDELDRFVAAYDALIEEYGDDPEAEISDELDGLSAKIDALSEGADQWRGEDIARCGVLIGIAPDGKPQIERGLLRGGDKHVRTGAAGEGSGPAQDNGANAGLSSRLIEELTTERTAALRAVMLDNERVSLTALAHALTLPLFYSTGASHASCLDLHVTSRDLTSGCDRMAGLPAERIATDRYDAWKARLPADPHNLFGWLLDQDASIVTALIGFVAAVSVDAVQARNDRSDCPRLAHADELAAALDLDMAAWWKPTRESYLCRVSKALIIEAITEGCSAQAAENLVSLKKDELVARAEAKLAGTGWLPRMLRPAVVGEPVELPIAEAAE